MSNGHDVERAYIQAVLDHRAAKLADATASIKSDLARLRESWSSGYAEQLAGHADRMAAMREDQTQWITNFINRDADEGARTDVGQGHGASATGPAPAPGPGPGQPNPHEAEAERARAIRDMSMAEYAARRADLGVRASTSMDRLFREMK